MFSSLTKLADKSFILGFFLPALIGIFGFLFTNRDVAPLASWYEAAMSATVDAAATALVFVWLFSIMLLAFNHLAFRLLEGYMWPFRTRPAKWLELKRRERQIIRIENYEKAWQEAERSLASLRKTDATEMELKPLMEEVERRSFLYFRAMEVNLREFPEKSLVLATRFGNAIRSFEVYSTKMYQVDSIYVWPRLLAVVPKEYQALMADARALVDFFVGLVVMLDFIAIIASCRAVYSLYLCPESPLLCRFMLTAVVALGVGYFCYRQAVQMAMRWGETVKGAFDVYLPELARAFGFDLPSPASSKRKFWAEWSTQFRFQAAADLTGFKQTGRGDKKKRGAAEEATDEDDDDESS